MKITDIRVHILQSELEQPFAFSQGWVKARSATIVEIHTDHGLIGWGEAFAQGLEPPQIAASAIEYSLKPLILGQDPRNIEVLWHSMYNHTRDFGRKGSIIAAISGIDIALWDLLGKAYEAPVSQLMGGDSGMWCNLMQQVSTDLMVKMRLIVWRKRRSRTTTQALKL